MAWQQVARELRQRYGVRYARCSGDDVLRHGLRQESGELYMVWAGLDWGYRSGRFSGLAERALHDLSGGQFCDWVAQCLEWHHGQQVCQQSVVRYVWEWAAAHRQEWAAQG